MYKIYQICLLLCLSSFFTTIYSEVKFAPYYNLQITEGVSIPSRGGWFFDLHLANDIGMIAKLNNAHSLIGFYQIKYSGPGVKRQEGEQFTNRTMDHMVVFRHHWDTPWNFRLKSQIDYWKQLRRSGTNELWGYGLYDINRFGGLLGVQKKFGEVALSGNFQYHSMIFPNYTDLLAELRVTEGGTAESSAGKQDHALTQLGLSGEWKMLKGSVDITLQNYFRQKVITNIVQPDGSFYSGALQSDTIVTIASAVDLASGIFATSPGVKYGMRASNQNYLHFDDVTSTAPAKISPYHSDYYSFSQLSLSLPLYLSVAKAWELFLILDHEIKSYSSRPARDGNGNFLKEKQQNALQIITCGFNYMPNPVTTTTLYLANQTSSSNMKYEKYLPYNFTAFSFGVRFSYRY